MKQSLRETHALLGQLTRHEHAPLALAQRCSHMPARTPLFSALLNYRHSPISDVAATPRGWQRAGSDAISPWRALSTACLSAAGASSIAVSERDTGVASCLTASSWPVSTESATARTLELRAPRRRGTYALYISAGGHAAVVSVVVG